VESGPNATIALAAILKCSRYKLNVNQTDPLFFIGLITTLGSVFVLQGGKVGVCRRQAQCMDWPSFGRGKDVGCGSGYQCVFNCIIGDFSIVFHSQLFKGAGPMRANGFDTQ
jgi:hypothetical protein